MAASGSDAGLRSISIKIDLSFHPALPPQIAFIIKLHANTFEEESPETTLALPNLNNIQIEYVPDSVFDHLHTCLRIDLKPS